MERAAVAVSWVGDVLSTTCAVKLELPCSFGVPEMVPSDDRVSPAGSKPAEMVHE